eukprot:Nk52_evm61s343 gene=Nk52_evmTU61s343
MIQQRVINVLGEPVPEVNHAVSVCLPTWEHNVQYEKGNQEVVSKLKCGYPRFVYHPRVKDLMEECLSWFDQSLKYGREMMARGGWRLFSEEFRRLVVADNMFSTQEYDCVVVISELAANECADFIVQRAAADISNSSEVEDLKSSLYIVDLGTQSVHAIFFPSVIDCITKNSNSVEKIQLGGYAKEFWQHTGEIVSSRLAMEVTKHLKWPQGKTGDDEEEFDEYIDERFARTLPTAMHKTACELIKQRLGCCYEDVFVEDIFLFPCGMGAVYRAFRLLQDACGGPRDKLLGALKKQEGIAYRPKPVVFGWTYLDTLKIMEKFNYGGCHFFGNGDEEDIEKLADLLASLKEKYPNEKSLVLGLFCEVPSNPLLKTPNTKRLKELASEYNFPIVVDDTLANHINVNAASFADVIASSLTKLFSGDSNVMGGSLILPRKSPFYDLFKIHSKALTNTKSPSNDYLFEKDAMILERNSRDFFVRAAKINRTTEMICDFLSSHPKVERIHYPKSSENFSTVRSSTEGLLKRLEEGDPDCYTQMSDWLKQNQPFFSDKLGFGCLFSVVLKQNSLNNSASVFYDHLEVTKGPSLGTNFTLCCPYTILAHFHELEFAELYGISRNLVRISVGMEDYDTLKKKINAALDAIPA